MTPPQQPHILASVAHRGQLERQIYYDNPRQAPMADV